MKPELLTAIIAATAALSGVIISQAISIFLSFLDKRHRRAVLLREKYEEMMFQFQDSLTYYSQVGTCKDLDSLLQNSHSVSAQRTLGLALLYFPKLAPALEDYCRAQVSYYSVIVSLYKPDIPATAAAQARVHNKQAVEDVERKLFSSKDKVLDELKMGIKQCTKA